jgi:uncharacterized peroxidase-related enzyme
MAFIETVPASKAQGEVLAMYERQQSEWGYVPDYAKVFCHRPEVMARWGRMLAEIKRPVDPRRLELVTFAVAHQLNHSSCSLAHGSALAKIIGNDAVIAIAAGQYSEVLTDTERAIVEFARRIARDASAITAAEVSTLKAVHGLQDEEIFDIAAIAASRCFFTKLLDALGSEPDRPFMQLDDNLRRSLTVGRPISDQDPETIPRDRQS